MIGQGGATAGVETTLAGFARALRAAGLPVTPDRTQAFLRACAAAGVADRSRVFWAGRATLCSDPDHFRRYDTVFRDWFGGEVPPAARARASVPARVLAGLADGAGGQSRPDAEREQEIVRARASALCSRSSSRRSARGFRGAAPSGARRPTAVTSTPGGRCASCCAAAASRAASGTGAPRPARGGSC